MVSLYRREALGFRVCSLSKGWILGIFGVDACPTRTSLGLAGATHYTDVKRLWALSLSGTDGKYIETQLP